MTSIVIKSCASSVLTLCFLLTLAGGTLEPESPETGSVSPSNGTLTYKSVPSYNPKGMEFLYQATNLFLDILVLNRSFPDVTSNGTQFSLYNLYDPDSPYHSSLLQWETGFLVCAIVGVIYIVAMFFTAIIFGCCRLFGGCGAQQSKMDGKYAKCKRITYGTMFFLVTMLMLFGVICTFVTNEYVESAVLDIPTKLHTSLQDVNTYLTHTDMEARVVLTKDYQELVKSRVDRDLQNAGELLLEDLMKLTGLTQAMADLTALSQQAKTIQDDLNQLGALTGELNRLATNVTQQLVDFQNQARDLIATGQIPANCVPCTQLVTQALSFKIGPEFSRLPDVRITLANVSRLVEENVNKMQSEGLKKHSEITNSIRNRANSTIEDARLKVDDVGREVAEIANVISDYIHQIKAQLSGFKSHVSRTNDYVVYRRYAYYAGIAISSIILLVVLLNSLGLMYGACAPRPTDRYDDSCTRGSGASLLMAGVFFSFLFCWIMMAVCIALFLTGGHLHLLLCDPLVSPNGLTSQESNTNELGSTCTIFGCEYLRDLVPSRPLENSHQFKILDYYFTTYGKEAIYDKKDVPVTVEGIIMRCNNNASFYDVFKIEYIHNLSAVITEFKQENQVSRVLKHLDSLRFDTTSVRILSAANKAELRRLAGLSQDLFDFQRYRNELNKVVIASNRTTVQDFLDGLRVVAQDVGQTEPEFNHSLFQLADYIENLQRGVVANIHSLARSINASLEQLLIDSNMTEMVENFIQHLEIVEARIRNQGESIAKTAVQQRANKMLSYFHSYLDYTQYKVSNEVGTCEPVSRAFNASVYSVCKETLYPLNGFWAGLGICLLMLIPSIILAVKLAGLYRKIQPYTAIDDHGRRRHYSSLPVEKQRRSNGHYYDNSQEYYKGYEESSPSRRHEKRSRSRDRDRRGQDRGGHRSNGHSGSRNSSHHNNRLYEDRDDDQSTVWEYSHSKRRPPPYNYDADSR